MRRLAALALLLVLAGCGGASEPASNGQLGPVELVERLREGGLVVYLRHAHTDRSKEDQGLVDPADCSTQRNLSEAGREQARTIGRGFRELGIPVRAVLASEYCRTRETAELAFGRAEAEPDLTGFPNEGEAGYEKRVRVTRELLGRRPPGGANTVLVAHVDNIEAAAGVSLEEGELAVFEPRGGSEFRHLGSLPATVWPQLAAELGD